MPPTFSLSLPFSSLCPTLQWLQTVWFDHINLSPLTQFPLLQSGCLASPHEDLCTWLNGDACWSLVLITDIFFSNPAFSLSSSGSKVSSNDVFKFVAAVFPWSDVIFYIYATDISPLKSHISQINSNHPLIHNSQNFDCSKSSEIPSWNFFLESSQA